jgi:hypothetical protein
MNRKILASRWPLRRKGLSVAAEVNLGKPLILPTWTIVPAFVSPSLPMNRWKERESIRSLSQNNFHRIRTESSLGLSPCRAPPRMKRALLDSSTCVGGNQPMLLHWLSKRFSMKLDWPGASFVDRSCLPTKSIKIYFQSNRPLPYRPFIYPCPGSQMMLHFWEKWCGAGVS